MPQTAVSIVDDPPQTVAELRRQLDELAVELRGLTAERDEALAQQAAIGEVLQVINSSPGNLTPVFDAMLERAVRLCEAAFGVMHTFDSYAAHAVALHSVPKAFEEYLTARPLRFDPERSFMGRAISQRRTIHIEDNAAGEPYRNGVSTAVAAVELGGIRSLLHVPLIRDDAVLGVFTVFRQEVRPFTAKQIALLESFAAQAVIAMENARLLDELRERTHDLEEALEYQTATSDVLRVINGSVFDLEPVLKTVVSTATRLCRADEAVIYRNINGEYRWAAGKSLAPEYERIEREGRIRPGTGTLVGRAALDGQPVHILDAWTDPLYEAKDDARIGGVRTMLGVPLLCEGQSIGVIGLARRRVEAYTDKEIELVRTFADQAVIAMENARLLNELRQRTADLQETLEYQTAVSDVLKVISRSAFDLDAVLGAVVASAVTLCRAQYGVIFRNYDDEYRWAASHGLLAEYDCIERNVRIRPGPETLIGRVALEGRTVLIPDAWTDPLYAAKDDARTGNVRSMVGVPLIREGAVIGAIGMARSSTEPYSEREIQLVTTFADQTVIAIENARLLTETREALEQQTATTEVLQVINSSPGDLAPVFDAMLDKAMRLCGAAFGTLWTRDGDVYLFAAQHGAPPDLDTYLQNVGPVQPGKGSAFAQLMDGAAFVQFPDIAAERLPTAHPMRRALVEMGGARTMLLVSLRRDDALLGAFHLYRQEVRPFTDKQIALLENFAAQAVIAMENARLIDEIRQRQAELRVTFDNMGDGVVMFDEELRLAAWNRNFQEMLDLPDAVLAERPSYAEYLRILAERGEFGGGDIEGELSRRLAEADQELRLERTRPDGRVIEVRRNTVPGGGFVLIYSDITERKEAEARLRAARDTAEGALRELRAAQASLIHAEKMASLGQLTAGIAHEIKNPLNFVNNFAGLSVELLDELKEAAASAVASLGDDERADIDELVATLSGNLDKIAEHGRRADGIVTSMLLHSRGGSGERRQVDLNALVDEALNLAYYGARAQDQSFNITLERDFAPAIPPIELVPQDMTRVFINLIGNGFHAAQQRRRETAEQSFTPVLKVVTRDLGDAVEVRVRDNGTGIRPEHRDKLFQPFFTTKPTGQGTGLGLSISYDIVTQQHGGMIEVDSEPGVFTEFTVRLPRSLSERSE